MYHELIKSVNKIQKDFDGLIVKSQIEQNKDYINYIAENVDKSIEYASYLADNLDNTIKYSEYIAEALNSNIEYATYNAEINDYSKKYYGNYGSTGYGIMGSSGTSGLPGTFGSSGTSWSNKIKESNLTKYGVEPFQTRNMTNSEIVKIEDTIEKYAAYSVRLCHLYFDNELVEFLNLDDLNIFTDNIKKLRIVGHGIDKSTVFEIVNHNGDKIFIAYLNSYFYKYENKIDYLVSEGDIDNYNLSIMDIDRQIEEQKLELQKLNNEKIIVMDNNTLKLIDEYNDKVKNYYDDVINNDNDLELEKSNLETLMNSETLSI